VGVCGKDKDILGIHSFLRLVVHGTMAYLDQLTDFAKGIESEETSPRDKELTDELTQDILRLFENGRGRVIEEFPKALVDGWKATGVYPEGIGRDLFKASQKLDGGTGSVQDILAWAFKGVLAGCVAQMLQGRLKSSVFGDTSPTDLEVNLGVLWKEAPNILLYGHFSPILKQKIAEVAKKRIGVMGVCTDPLIPPHCFAPVTNYGSQEIPVMTGVVDLVVAGDQCVNPCLADMAKDWDVTIFQTEVLKRDRDLGRLAKQILEQAERAFKRRRKISREIPEVKELALMGLAILAGCNNVKYTQDREILSMTRDLLKRDIFCVSEGCASVSLGKYGLLNPRNREGACGKGLSKLFSSLGENLPPVIDLGSCENPGVTDFLLDLAKVGGKLPKEFPIVACFPEANRSRAVARAVWTVALGVSTYFWPSLPVTGSMKTMDLLKTFCKEEFGAEFHVMTEKMTPAQKVDLVIDDLKRQ
jgi:carbon-monoxide dehydrogenase catalytic subunit